MLPAVTGRTLKGALLRIVTVLAMHCQLGQALDDTLVRVFRLLRTLCIPFIINYTVNR